MPTVSVPPYWVSALAREDGEVFKTKQEISDKSINNDHGFLERLCLNITSRPYLMWSFLQSAGPIQANQEELANRYRYSIQGLVMKLV